MKNVFYLPTNITIEKARSLWHKLDSDGDENATFAYIYDEATDVKTADRSLKDVLKKVEHESLIILWSVSQIDMDMKEFSVLLMAHKGRSVSVRILNPNYTLDPGSSDSHAVMALMESMQQNSSGGRERLPSGFGYKPLASDVIAAIRKGKHEGKTIRALSREFDVSVPTICKYTKGIIPIHREQRKPTPKRSGELFDYDLLKDLPLAKPSRILESVREFIKFQRTYHTKRNYFQDLLKFFNWVKADRSLEMQDPDEITFEMASSYLEHLLQSGHKKSAIKRYIATLKVYCSYCLKRSYIKSNELSTIKVPKVPRHKIETEIIEPDELKRILSYAMRIVKSRGYNEMRTISHRNFVGLYLLSTVGMRIGSLLSIRLMDIKERQGRTFITMQSKGNDEYTAPLDKTATSILKVFIETYFKDKPEDSFIMFSSQSAMSQPMSISAFAMAIKKIVKSSGIDKKITAHSFRATVATEGYRAGRTLKELQVMLNHKNIEQTSAYIKWSEMPSEATWMPNLGDELNGYAELVGT
jgi:integrase/recombinase XerD